MGSGEEQQAMSEERLTEIESRVIEASYPRYDYPYSTDAKRDMSDLLAEVERQRAREAALVAVAVGAAALDDRNGIVCDCRLNMPFGHYDDCWVLQAQMIAHTTPDGEMDG